MKKLICVILAVCLAMLSALTFTACDSDIESPQDNGKYSDKDIPQDNEKYYAYDAEADEYEDGDYITLNGNTAVWHGVDIVLGEMDFNGSVIYSDDDFIITLNGELSSSDKCIMNHKGKKESDGVLRVSSTVITRYSALVTEPNVTTDTIVKYYCKKNSKPVNPILPNHDPEPPKPSESVAIIVTFDGNGGTFDGEKTVQIEAGEKGRVTLPKDPKRAGYVFNGYNLKKTGTDFWIDEYTPFIKDTTVYALWVKEVTVKFVNDGHTVETRKVAQGRELGELPYLRSLDPDEGVLFKGWYDGLYKQYNSYSTVDRDVTLNALWWDKDQLNAYDETFINASWFRSGHIYIHYLRHDHNDSENGLMNMISGPAYGNGLLSKTYSDWLIWAWPTDGKYKNIGRVFYPMRLDMSGAIFDIDLEYVFSDGGWGSFDRELSFANSGIGFTFVAGSSMDEEYWKTDGDYISIFKQDVNQRHLYYLQGATYYPQYLFSELTKAASML